MLNPLPLAKKQIVIQLLNLLSNLLNTDSWSCKLRQKLLSFLGNQFGPRAVVWGGNSYQCQRSWINTCCTTVCSYQHLRRLIPKQ